MHHTNKTQNIRLLLDFAVLLSLPICLKKKKKVDLTKIVIVMQNEECARSSKRRPLNEELCVYQAAQQIIELQEAAQINAGLQPANLGRNTSLHDMKTVVKTWRNRLPIVSDDLSHWSSIFMWRQHHYQGTLLSRNPVKVSEVWKKK